MILSAMLSSIKMISFIDQLAAKNKISYQDFYQGRPQNSSTNLQMSRSQHIYWRNTLYKTSTFSKFSWLKYIFANSCLCLINCFWASHNFISFFLSNIRWFSLKWFQTDFKLTPKAFLICIQVLISMVHFSWNWTQFI